MPGPLPDPNRRRRNAPTIPTTVLDAAGRTEPAPRVPVGYALGARGRAWWKWAWSLPQSFGWSEGDLYLVARRARLEDDVHALAMVDAVDWCEIFEIESEAAAGRRLTFVLERLKGMAGGTLAVQREMREIDDRLGLTPKGLAALRWTIVAKEPEPEQPAAPTPAASDRRKRLTAV